MLFHFLKNSAFLGPAISVESIRSTSTRYSPLERVITNLKCESSAGWLQPSASHGMQHVRKQLSVIERGIVGWAQKAALIYLICLGCMTWGYGIAKFEWWPHTLIQETLQFIEGHPEAPKTTVIEKIQNDLGGRPSRKLVPYRAETEHPERPYRVARLPHKNPRRLDPLIFKSSKATPSLRFIYGSFDHSDSINGALLLSEEGQIIWQWRVTEAGLSWDEHASSDRAFPHGVLITPDGELIAAFDSGVSLQKIDRCSQRVWATKTRVDHSLSLAPNGDIWGVLSPDSLLVFDPKTGRRKRQLDMMKIIDRNPEIDPLGLRQLDTAHQSKWVKQGGSFWHPNDVEPLPSALADAFPQFDSGDLLISMRSINLVFVLSPKNLQIKWWRIGAWRRQHDPDWQPNGMITVFNNNSHRAFSTIVQIDPKTYQSEVIFNGEKEKFYSWMRGKHQRLSSGHLVITSPQQGRFFEVTPEGEVVFEFVNRFDSNHAMLISEAITLPLDYFHDSFLEPCP